MEQLQLVTFCVSSDGVLTLYLTAPQWQLASYQTLAGMSEFDMAQGLNKLKKAAFESTGTLRQRVLTNNAMNPRCTQ